MCQTVTQYYLIFTHFRTPPHTTNTCESTQTYCYLSLDNDQLDAHLLYFTIRPLQSSTCFEYYMLIIRRLNCIDAASGIVLLVSGRPVHRMATD